MGANGSDTFCLRTRAGTAVAILSSALERTATESFDPAITAILRSDVEILHDTLAIRCPYTIRLKG